MGLINGTVYLQENHLLWSEMFKHEKNKLQELFKDLAIEIEHVGSTAVRELPAKPIIDIAIGVNNITDVLDISNTLSMFYTIKDNKDEILLIKENSLETFFIIHILDIKSDRYKNMILFRNILINSKEIREDYKNLKQKLAKKYSNDRKMYTKAKNSFIQKTLKNNIIDI